MASSKASPQTPRIQKPASPGEATAATGARPERMTGDSP